MVKLGGRVLFEFGISCTEHNQLSMVSMHMARKKARNKVYSGIVQTVV